LHDSAYQIVAELDSGGGGIVYKAWHTRLQKYVVIKKIKEGPFSDPKLVRTEVDILKNLKHSHLPQLYDFVSDSSGSSSVMELIPGQSFAELLKTGVRFSPQDVVRWGTQLSSALEYLHAQKPPVLHSDIKPAIISYRSAIAHNNTNPEYFRDLAIALARTGQIDEAFDLLTGIMQENIGSDSISLLRGELAFAGQDFYDAVRHFRELLDTTNDVRIRQRAYIYSDRALSMIPDLIDQRIDLLREAMGNMPLQYNAPFTERLAHALVLAGQMTGQGDGSSCFCLSCTFLAVTCKF